MTPKRALEQVSEWCWFLSGSERSGGAREYVLAGRDIPERLLPGRLIMRESAEVRAALSRLTSADAADVAPWHVRVVVEMTPRPRTLDDYMPSLQTSARASQTCR